MSTENNKQIAKNTIYLYIRMLVLMLVSLYTTRVLLKVLGIDDYGIFNVVGGLIVMITFISQGLTAAARRFIMAEMTTGDLHSQRVMYSNVVLAHILMSIAILLIGETIGLWFFSHYLNIPENRFHAAMWVYQLSLVSSIGTIMLLPFNAIIVSEEKMVAYAYFSIIDALLKLLIVWALVVVKGDKLITYSAFLVGVGVVDFCMYYGYCRSKFPICKLVKINGINQLKELFGYMGWTVFGLGANVASRQGVTMLVNIYYNVAVNAAIGISNMIISAASQFVSSFQMAFVPQLTKNYISKNNNELTGLLNRSSRYSSFLVLIILIPITIVITDLLEIWLGDYPKYTEEFCILTLFCIYFDAMSNPLITVITADNNIKKYQIYIAAVHLMDFCISWSVLVLGALPYMVICVRAALCVAGMIIRLVFVKRRVCIFSVKEWTKSVIGRGAIIVLLSTPLFLIRILFEETQMWCRFLSMTMICIIWVAVLLWFIGLNKRERLFIINKMSFNIKKRQ